MQRSHLEHLKDRQAREILLKFSQDIAVALGKAKAEHLIPLTPPKKYPQDIERPQVFISYAWGNETDPEFKAFQTFLNDLKEDFGQAGIDVWFDQCCLAGDIDFQMRSGINNSNVILLMGTKLYAQKKSLKL